MKSPLFKNTQGKWLTKALFYELTLPDSRDHAVFTLKDEDITVDGQDYVSLKTCFLSSDDPTEYDFATKFLGGWQHWKELQKTRDLKAHITEWREERDVKLRSKGVRRIIEQASSEEASYQAAKWLADKGWEEPQTKGRPSKAQVERAAKEEAALKSRTKSDLARIKGG